MFLGVLFVILMAGAIGLNMYLVLIKKTKSISMRTWIATKAHPTLIAAGILATVGICYLVAPMWGLVCFAGIMGGHLFVHW